MSDKSTRLYHSIQNTLNLLTNNGLTLFYNPVILQRARGNVRITWPNHVSGRHNCNPNFCKIIQYREIVKSGAYTCLLFDGSIVRVSYCFDCNELSNYSALWWPSPFCICPDDIEIGGVLDIFDLYASYVDWHKHIQMRTPFRFDYDSRRYSIDHPVSHLHFQHRDCRLYVDRPICFNMFIKFIFKNFYPEKYAQCDFWEDLEIQHFSIEPINEMIPRQPYLGWNKTITI